MRQNLKMAVPAATDLRAMVALTAVTARFGRVTALDKVTFDVRAGEILCLLGPSGSGKSTLLRLVAGIERPSHGSIALDGAVVAGGGAFVEPERRRVGMVFQDYALFPHLTVADNVAFGLRNASRRDAAQRAGWLLDRVGLSRYASSYPHMLSGGERQRVALARALAPEPRVLLMDEPFSSLDRGLRDRVRRETLALLRETGTTTIIVTHDPAEAVLAADRIALLRAGRLLQCGSPEELYTKPASAFVAQFLGDVNEFPGTCRNGRVHTAFGSFLAPQIPEQAAARVCIRPEHLRVSREPAPIRGRVVSSEFLGETERVLVDVADMPSPISVRTLGRLRLVPGDMVHLDVDSSQVIVLPDEGIAPASGIHPEA